MCSCCSRAAAACQPESRRPLPRGGCHNSPAGHPDKRRRGHGFSCGGKVCKGSAGKKTWSTKNWSRSISPPRPHRQGNQASIYQTIGYEGRCFRSSSRSCHLSLKARPLSGVESLTNPQICLPSWSSGRYSVMGSPSSFRNNKQWQYL